MVIMGHGLGSVRRVKRESRHLHDGSMLGMMFLVCFRRAREGCRACGDLIKPQQSEPFMTDTIDGSYSFDNQYRYLRGVISLLSACCKDFTRTALAVLWLVVILFTPLAVVNVEGLQVGSFAARWIVTPHVYSSQGFRKNVNLDRQAVLSTQRFAQNHVSNI